jgi:fused signal recognition particle receptor
VRRAEAEKLRSDVRVQEMMLERERLRLDNEEAEAKLRQAETKQKLDKEEAEAKLQQAETKQKLDKEEAEAKLQQAEAKQKLDKEEAEAKLQQAEAKQKLDKEEAEANMRLECERAAAKQKLENEEAEAKLRLERAEAKLRLDSMQAFAQQKLDNERAEAKQKLSNEKAEAKQKLDNERAEAKQKLDNEKAEEKQKLECEKAKLRLATKCTERPQKAVKNQSICDVDTSSIYYHRKDIMGKFLSAVVNTQRYMEPGTSVVDPKHFFVKVSAKVIREDFLDFVDAFDIVPNPLANKGAFNKFLSFVGGVSKYYLKTGISYGLCYSIIRQCLQGEGVYDRQISFSPK